MLQLMAAIPETDADRIEVQNSINGFRTQLNKCTSEDYNYFKTAADMYARFLFASGRDIKRTMDQALKDKNSIDSNWSVECKAIIDSLVSIYKVNEIRQAYLEINEGMKLIREKAPNTNNGEGEMKSLIDNYRDIQSKEWNRLNDFYRVVFNQSLDVY